MRESDTLERDMSREDVRPMGMEMARKVTRGNTEIPPVEMWLKESSVTGGTDEVKSMRGLRNLGGSGLLGSRIAFDGVLVMDCRRGAKRGVEGC